jgi:hypothetical protein
MIFAAPLALLALALLPMLYFILRLTPPEPQRQRFPPIALLQDLPETQHPPRHIPPWLLLLRLGALACLILGLAAPTLRPPPALPGTGPVLLVLDNGWASAAAWPQMLQTAKNILTAARTQNRAIAILTTAIPAAGDVPELQGPFDAATALQILSAIRPEPWPADRKAAAAALRGADETTRLYISDGTGGGPAFQTFLTALHLTSAFKPATLPPLLAPPALNASGNLTLHAISNPLNAALLGESAGGDIITRMAFDPSGNATLDLPLPIANKIAKFVLDGPPTAGGTVIVDSSTRASLAALDSGSANADSPFLGTLYFLRRALPQTTKIITGSFEQILAGKPATIFLADSPLSPAQQALAKDFIAGGGILVRFAGPLTSETPDAFSADTLLSGERHLGGALSWTTPEQLAPFPATSPFAGLAADPKVIISQQILADPTTLDPATIWATLRDGTPLILGKPMGHGYLVNILTSANADWSNLPLSGLYPAILARLSSLGQGSPVNPNLALPLQSALDAYGTLSPPGVTASLTPARRGSAAISPALPPGLYGNGPGFIALNLGFHVQPPVPANLPNATPLGAPAPPRNLGPLLVALSLALLLLDLAFSLASRRVLRLRRLGLVTALALPFTAHAQSAALQTELGYIVTNNPATDQISADGLGYLSANVSAHSSIQLGAPVALNPGKDDLSFYPLIYWPLLPSAPVPSPAACDALNTYMKYGGLLVIDMPGSDPGAAGSGAGFAPGASAAFTRATACLNLPPLEAISPDNVLARSFYIIPDYSGRFTGAPVLIATPPALDADGVTPIIVSQNDWAGAWARDASGEPEQTPLPGAEDQRVVADRFGINLVIYALTGSYKSSPNAAPALLDKLGQ